MTAFSLSLFISKSTVMAVTAWKGMIMILTSYFKDLLKPS